MNPQIGKDQSPVVNLALDLRTLASPLLVLGGAHTGKSELAVQAFDLAVPTAVIGTADSRQPEFSKRIAQLRALRPEHWPVSETTQDLAGSLKAVCGKFQQVLVDSLSQYIGSALVHGSSRYSLDQLETLLTKEIDEICAVVLSQTDTRWVLVASEVGGGIAPAQPMARLYRQTVSQFNAKAAKLCAHVVLVSAGIPQLIK